MITLNITLYLLPVLLVTFFAGILDFFVLKVAFKRSIKKILRNKMTLRIKI